MSHDTTPHTRAPPRSGFDWADPHHFHHGDDAQADHDHDGHHVTPWQLLFGILFVLLFLTFLTVVSAQAETVADRAWASTSATSGTSIIAMAIALVKATLVCMYFMHLKHDNPLNTMILLSRSPAPFPCRASSASTTGWVSSSSPIPGVACSASSAKCTKPASCRSGV
jgi:caa(3)-type oxidase subunit IV